MPGCDILLMILNTHSADALYLSNLLLKSRAGGHLYLGNRITMGTKMSQKVDDQLLLLLKGF